MMMIYDDVDDDDDDYDDDEDDDDDDDDDDDNDDDGDAYNTLVVSGTTRGDDRCVPGCEQAAGASHTKRI
jgi:hypothetical protein